MDLLIKTGEYLWNPDGTHLMNTQGIAVKATEDTTVTFNNQEAYDRAVAARSAAEARGIDK